MKRQLLADTAAAVALGVVIALIYWLDRHYERDLREQQGRHRVNVGLEVISRETTAVFADLLYLAEQQVLMRYLSGEESARGEVEAEYERFADRKAIYDQIRYLDESGQEMIRVNFSGGRAQSVPHGELQRKDDRYYFQEALLLRRGEVFVSDFDLNVEHGAIERPLKPVVRFLTPVFDASGRRRGLLALNYLGSQLLTELDEIPLPGLTLLLKADGQYLLGPELGDAWGWMLGHERSFDQQFPQAWRAVKQRSEEEFLKSEGFFVTRTFDLSARSSANRLTVIDPARGTDAPQDVRRRMSVILVSYLPRQQVFAESSQLLWKLILTAAGAMLVVAVLAHYWAQAAVVRQQQTQRIADSETRLRQLSAQLLAAQETERRMISRELHDELGQLVTAISLDVQSAARQQNSERRQLLLDRAEQEIEQLLRNLHEFATRVRPAVLDDLGLLDAVESFCADFQHRTGIAVEAKMNFQPHLIPRSVGENVYRILQEALTNVAKHAKTNRVSVNIEADQERLRMHVRDDGQGFDVEQPGNSRLGLLGMRERVELLAGDFRLTSVPGEGTQIVVDLPLRNGPT